MNASTAFVSTGLVSDGVAPAGSFPQIVKFGAGDRPLVGFPAGLGMNTLSTLEIGPLQPAADSVTHGARSGKSQPDEVLYVMYEDHPRTDCLFEHLSLTQTKNFCARLEVYNRNSAVRSTKKLGLVYNQPW